MHSEVRSDFKSMQSPKAEDVSNFQRCFPLRSQVSLFLLVRLYMLKLDPNHFIKIAASFKIIFIQEYRSVCAFPCYSDLCVYVCLLPYTCSKHFPQ